MSTGWSAGEFRRVRMVAVAVIAVGWAALILAELGECEYPDCVPGPITGGNVVIATMIAFLTHLGLLISIVAERGGPEVRFTGMVFLLPSTLLAVVWARVLWLGGGIDAPVAALTVAYSLAHLVQFWALSGIPFPRVAPLAPKTLHDESYFFHPHRRAGR